jgi:lysophospholipase L1-like esterase
MRYVKTWLWSLALILSAAILWACTSDEKKVIVCWGDSLTAPHNGRGFKGKLKRLVKGTDYPGYLEEMLGSEYEVINAGVGGENTLTIMARQGAYPMKLTHDVVISKESITLVGNNGLTAFVSTYNGVEVAPLQQYTWKQDGPSQINPCSIGNQRFQLSSIVHSGKEDGVFKTLCSYYLTPEDKQTTVDTLRAGSIVTTYAMSNLRGQYANVFFIGQNGGFSDVADLIRQLSAMIAYSQSNRYIVISFHKTNHVINTIPRMMEMEDSLSISFGKHYVNLREYMVTNGLADAKYSPTQADKDSIAKGVVPPQLLADDCHFTTIGYNVIAKLVYERMKELGYIPNE